MTPIKKLSMVATGICLTVTLNVNSLPIYAYTPLDAFVESLKLLNSPAVQAAAQVIILNLTSPQPKAFPVYTDDEWAVTMKEDGNDITYYGVNVKTKAGIILRNVRIQDNQKRRVYSWNNSGTIYQLAFQPEDPDFIRLQVFEGNELLLNRLLTRYKSN